MKAFFLIQFFTVLFLFLLVGCDDNEIDSKEDLYEMYTVEEGLASNYVTSIAIDNENNVWVGTDSGLCKFDGISWVTYTEGLASRSIYSLHIDQLGKLWIGTSYGLSKMNESNQFSNYLSGEGSASKIFCLNSDQSNNIWIGRGYSTITKYDEENFTNFIINPSDPTGSNNGHIHTITIDNSGNVWAGGCFTGLSMYDGANWEHRINNFGCCVESSICDSKGVLWIGDIGGGIYNYHNDVWTQSSDSSICSITEEENGNIWAVTSKNLMVFKGSSWKTVDLIKESITQFKDIEFDHDGNLWICGGNKGLFMIKKSTIDDLGLAGN